LKPKFAQVPEQSEFTYGGHLVAAEHPEPEVFRVFTLHVEYAERGLEYGILFIFSLLCEYIHLEYVRIHGIYRVKQAEHVIHILVVAPQEYMNIYSTRRAVSLSCFYKSIYRHLGNTPPRSTV